jgi:nucleotide-binding universal stress UspA family protein
MPDTKSQPQMHATTGHAPTTVIVGVDGSDGSIFAIRWAAGHARDIGARLRLIYAASEPATATITLPLPVNITGGVTRRHRSRPGERVMARATAEARRFAPGVEVSGRLDPGGAVDALVYESTDASLLVVGSRDLGRSSGSSASSIGMQVAAQARCPTVVVRGEGEPGGPVVVAVDGCETSEPALRFAFADAARRRAGLVAVHVWTPPAGTPGIRAYSATGGPDHAELRRAGRYLTEAVALWRPRFPSVDAIELVLENTPEAALPQSTAGASLVVVGTRGQRISGPLLSSTSKAMLAGAGCPVVVVREPETPG